MMDKLIFRKISPRVSKKDWMVRIDEAAYLRALALSQQTGLPLVVVITSLVNFALDHTEVLEDAN